MIQGVIFDLGSTLMYLARESKEIDAESTTALAAYLHANGVPVADNFAEAFFEARRRGWKLSEETNIEHTVGEALADALASLGHSSVDGLIARAVDHFFASGEIHWTPYPGAVETLQALKASGLHVGIISNADDDGIVQRTSTRLGFRTFAEPIISSASLRWRKPDPRIFHHVARGWGLAPERIAMVGDSPRYDIIGAHRAGMRAILIDRQENHTWQLIPDGLVNEPGIHADAVVGHLLEIPPLLDSL